jgi:hypothetical protein
VPERCDRQVPDKENVVKTSPGTSLASILRLFLLGFFLPAAWAWAADNEDGELPSEEPPAEEEPPPPAAGPGAGTRLQIHGYLTQAYAQSDGLGVFGATEDGTTDYRTLALQVSYELDRASRFVVQLAHQRLGDADDFADDVFLDWAFFEHRFGDRTKVRAGRILTPIGLMNEVRDVGILLPFFRVPESFYGETSFSLETIDGLSIGHEFRADSGWGLEAIAFAGGWDTADPPASLGRAEDGTGLTAIVKTPFEGLRLAGGYLEFLAEEGSVAPDTRERRRYSWGAVELARERFSFIAETSRFVRRGVSDERAWYAQATYRPFDKLSLHGQFEHGDIDLLRTPFGRFDIVNDWAVGFSFHFKPQAAVKGEYHFAYRRNADGVSFIPTGTPGDAKVDYFILSLAAAF